MRLKIIYPARLNPQGRPIKTRAKIGRFLNLSAIYLAGLTPAGHEIDVMDDLFEDINFDEPVDLVALTAMTSQAPRAYQIATEYRKRGVKVVMGGFHASFLPEEAAQYVDAVVIGEGELAWPQVLEDAEHNRLQKFYRPSRPGSLAGLPAPRYDLMQGKPYHYIYFPAWVGRGCPHDCKFCTVTSFYGKELRWRPVDDILKDVSVIPCRKVLFIDDNFFAYKQISEDLLRGLAPFKLTWSCQFDPAFAKNEKLMDLAALSGLSNVYIGFETVFPERLSRLDKSWAALKDGKETVRRLHDKGIMVWASLIFAADRETPETVREALRRLEDWKMDTLCIYFFSPLPGSRLYQELLDQGAEFSRDWSLYDGVSGPVLVPGGMTAKETEKLYWTLYENFYSYPSIARRFWRKPVNGIEYLRNLARNLIVYRTDMKQHRAVLDNYFSYGELLPGYSSRK